MIQRNLSLTLLLSIGLASLTWGQSTSPVAIDVELEAGGKLIGQVVDTSGNPIGKQRFSILDSRGASYSVVSDDAGHFTLSNLRGGLYELQTSKESVVLRLWSHRTAPPKSAQRLLVAVPNVERGQDAPSAWSQMFGIHEWGKPAIPCGTCDCHPECGRLFGKCGHCACQDACCDGGGCRPALFSRNLAFPALAAAIVYAAFDEDDAS